MNAAALAAAVNAGKAAGNTCAHRLGALPCLNTDPHPGAGAGCVHASSHGSDLNDRHTDGGHG